MTEGAQWIGQKNFTVKCLKNFGSGKKDLEGVIIEQACELVDYIESFKGSVPVNGSLFAVPILNVLWAMVAGYSFKCEDEHMKMVLELTSYIFTSKIFVIANALPWIRFIFPSLTGYNKRLKAFRLMREQIRDEIKKHEVDLDEENPRDFIDAYLTDIKMKFILFLHFILELLLGFFEGCVAAGLMKN